MFIEGSSGQIDARDAHIWWNSIGKVIKVVTADPAQIPQLTRAGYRYETGAAYRAWREGDDKQRIRAMTDLAVRLVAEGFHPTMIAREFSKVRQFRQYGGDAAIMGSTASA